MVVVVNIDYGRIIFISEKKRRSILRSLKLTIKGWKVPFLGKLDLSDIRYFIFESTEIKSI